MLGGKILLVEKKNALFFVANKALLTILLFGY